MLLRESPEVQLVKGLFFTHTGHLCKFDSIENILSFKEEQ